MLCLLMGAVTSTSSFPFCMASQAASRDLSAYVPPSVVDLPSSIATSSSYTFTRLIFLCCTCSASRMMVKLKSSTPLNVLRWYEQVLLDPKITGVHSSSMAGSANVLMMTSQPIPFISPCVIPTLIMIFHLNNETRLCTCAILIIRDHSSMNPTTLATSPSMGNSFHFCVPALQYVTPCG